MTGKHWRKTIQQLSLIFCKLKKWKYVQLTSPIHNSNREKQITLLMSSNEKDCHCLIALIRRMTSKNNGAFNDLNCLHPFRTENKLKCHEKVKSI